MTREAGEQQETARARQAATSQQNERREQRRRPMRRQPGKRCAFCADAKLSIDYKAVGQLHSYVSERGKILPRRATGLCARHQRMMALAIKRARHLALLPFTAEYGRGG